MADQIAHNVVNSDMSTAEPSVVDAHANQVHTYDAPVGPKDSAQSSDIAQPHSVPPTDLTSVSINPAGHQVSTSDKSSADSALLPPEPRPNGTSSLSINGPNESALSADEGTQGSDTDISRPGSVDQSKEENRQLKLGSTKKPTSFKSVSITKAFLAKTVGATPPPPSVGSKSPIPSTAQPLAKPRLVAKSGSGLRDIPRVRAGDGPAAPDARTVWNKNQPVPLPPPKQFTDEELKQQYGIHLASRLQEDEQDGKSKWADEDDDEDDWTPETVEWMDGTKSTAVKAAEQTVLPVPVPSSVPEPLQQAPQQAAQTGPQPPAQQAAPSKPVLTALKRPTPPTSSTTKTILRPGAAQQAKQNGLGSMGATEKQTLTSKATPTPVKSPWAPLPPIDRASPVAINPPQPPPVLQSQDARFAQRDPHGFPGYNRNAYPEPAREIAADTFDRSTYREGESRNRELFNSQSGRYEPAPEYRRGSRQQESGRQPAVLQRSSHQNGSGSAEPSAAFQTRTSAQVDGSSYGRRRGSSVSGGGAFPRDRRMSAARSSEMHGNEDAGRSVAHDTAIPAPVPENIAQAPAQPAEQLQPAVTLEDEIARQQKVLQESREAAKRRKQQEWEAEEAEKKERIRKRLEAMAPPPAAAKAEPQPVPITTQAVPAPAPEPVAAATRTPEISSAEPARLEPQATTMEPQASPLKLSPRKQRLGEGGIMPFGSTQNPFTRHNQKPVYEEPQLPGLKQHSPQLSTRTPFHRQPSAQGSAQGASGSSFSSPGEAKAQPARVQGTPNLSSGDSFPMWSSGGLATHTSPASNVWGPPSNNRGIGNGTFDTTGFARLASGQLQTHQNAPFAPSAPFGRQYSARISAQGFGDQRLNPSVNLETHVSEPSQSPQIDGTSPLPEPARLAYQPAPIGPPVKAGARLQHQQQQQTRDTSAWTNFAQQAETRDRDDNARVAAERAQNAPQARWTETFKQTQMDDRWLGGPRKVVNAGQTVHNVAAMLAGQNAVDSPAPPVTQSSLAHQMATSTAVTNEQKEPMTRSTVRLPTGKSDFIVRGNTIGAGRPAPVGVHPSGVQPLPPMPMTPTTGFQQSRFFPSVLYGGSPPPEEADHPVFGARTKNPLVKLPASKPKVKLPPAQAKSRQGTAPANVLRRTPSDTVGVQPLIARGDWQARFNGLFGKAQVNAAIPPSPPKTPPGPQTPALAVASATKTTISFAPSLLVSIPRSRPMRFESASKPDIDDIFNGELSFGSTPKVNLPQRAHYPAHVIGNPTGSREPRQRFSANKVVETRSKVELPASIFEHTRSNMIRMKLPKAWATAKEIPFQPRVPEKVEQPVQKPTAKFNKTQRHGSSAHATSAPESAKTTASVPPRGPAGSRQTSFKKTANTVPNQVTKTPSPVGNQSVAQSDENAQKKSIPTRPTRGGRGRNASHKARGGAAVAGA